MYANFVYLTFLYPIIYIFPAYAANGAPILFGGGRPLDGKAKLWGKRIFGDNKTVRGTVSSLLCGLAVGLIEYPFFHYMLPIAVLLAIGANVGDLLGSFIKRRLNVEKGASFPILDQYGFFVFALLFAFPLVHMPSIYGIIFLIVLTGLAHIFTNRGAHKLKLKKVPW
ncbi:MAG: CDP-2,3-bis-(O-geranylgeranyl)-sn-glycerol synthase [Candidatus Micrarchaeaceae archaeon]|nr:CDP-2,3-bis-(O-geranylgeranyl)-sn-glycerol synthase [Candidatus Micrarchaeota archaeon]HII10145.1 CDP-2,3-bis-(O-geranylgeranyl)-sn-glycerol synthase [Candidatus Micrarchaeota archaeon]